MTVKENNIVLLSITLCWAASYIFIKDLPPDLSSYAYLTMTTGIAAVILIAVFYKRLKKTDRKSVFQGLLLALMMAGNLLTEKKSLQTLPSSNASFIASMNILFVPMILLFFHQKPTRNHIAGMSIIILGLFITTRFQFSGFWNSGTLYMLIGCLFMAFYTILAADFTKESDPLVLGVLQIFFTAMIGFILWLMEDPRTFFSLTYSKQMLSSVFVLAFFTKAYAYIMLMYAEQYATAFRVTVIASTEPVVTLGLALMIPNVFGETETFHLRSLIGAVCIATGAVIAGTDFLSKKRKGEPSCSAPR